jgi:biopolymer transport protein ExbB
MHHGVYLIIWSSSHMLKKLTVTLLLMSLIPCAVQAAEFNFVEQAAEGGVAIVVILALSILFVAVTLERLMHFRASLIAPEGLIERVKPLWAAHDFVRLQQLLEREDSTLSRVISYMVTHRQQGFAIVGSGAGDMASIELRQHQQKAYALAIVATVAPIVGLLGTVLGMIDAFHVIAYADGMGNPALLAGGISKALVNTAGGLSVALPALGMHHFFKNRMAFLGLSLEQKINALIHEWFLPAPVPAQNLHLVAHAH